MFITVPSTSFRKFFFFFFFFFFFCLALYIEEVNLQTFVITIYAQKVLLQSFKKNQIVSLFSIIKMNANHAEICIVGHLEADFQ